MMFHVFSYVFLFSYDMELVFGLRSLWTCIQHKPLLPASSMPGSGCWGSLMDSVHSADFARDFSAYCKLRSDKTEGLSI